MRTMFELQPCPCNAHKFWVLNVRLDGTKVCFGVLVIQATRSVMLPKKIKPTFTRRRVGGIERRYSVQRKRVVPLTAKPAPPKQPVQSAVIVVCENKTTWVVNRMP